MDEMYFSYVQSTTEPLSDQRSHFLLAEEVVEEEREELAEELAEETEEELEEEMVVVEVSKRCLL